MIDFNLVIMVWASVSRLCEVVILGSLTRLKSFVCQFKILSILTQRENIRFQTSSSQHNFYYPHKYLILFPKLHSHSLTNILNFLILTSSLPVVKVWDGSENVNRISTLLWVTHFIIKIVPTVNCEPTQPYPKVRTAQFLTKITRHTLNEFFEKTNW